MFVKFVTIFKLRFSNGTVFISNVSQTLANSYLYWLFGLLLQQKNFFEEKNDLEYGHVFFSEYFSMLWL